MAPFPWGIKHLALFWLSALALSAALLGLGTLTLPNEAEFFWLIPYPSNLNVVWHTFAAIFADRPLEATALIIAPFFAIAITILWTVGWIWRAVRKLI